MRFVTPIIAVVVLLVGFAACAGNGRRPECHGPWTPINTAPPVSPHGQ